MSVPLDGRVDLAALDEAKILAAPADPAEWPRWRERLERWRTEARRRVAYDGRGYDRGRTDCFVVGVAWLWDELLYDHDRGTFTPDAFVEAAKRDFGGFDGVVLWHAYPIEGIDKRGQFDFYRAVPELPDVVGALQRRDVRVFVVYYPWEPSDPDDLAELVSWTGADGVFLDSAKEGDKRIRAALDALRPGLVLEAESVVPLGRIHDHAMSWAQWFADSPVPGVLRAKWFERRHVLHHTRRWHRSHLDEIHSAWLNGCGILVWECVFGVWVGWSARDRALLKGMRRVLDGFGPWLQSEHWTPLADHPGDDAPVCASRWEHEGTVLWTIANRGDDYEGPLLVTDVPATLRWAEPTAGRELTIELAPDGRTVVAGRLPAGGIAAVVASEHAMNAGGAAGPEEDASFPVRAAVRIPHRPAVRTSVPADTEVVEAGRHDLVIRYRCARRACTGRRRSSTSGSRCPRGSTTPGPYAAPSTCSGARSRAPR